MAFVPDQSLTDHPHNQGREVILPRSLYPSWSTWKEDASLLGSHMKPSGLMGFSIVGVQVLCNFRRVANGVMERDLARCVCVCVRARAHVCEIVP